MLGGFGLVRPAVHRKVAVLPLSDGRLVGVNVVNGQLLWETSIGVGLACGDIRADADGVLCAISDIRPIGQTGEAFLARVDVKTGSLTPVWQTTTSKISDLALIHEYMVLRTSQEELLCFDRSQNPKVRWRAGLETFMFASPVVVGERVVVSDGDEFSDTGSLKSFSITDGAPLPPIISTRGVILRAISGDDARIYYKEGSRRLAAADFKSDQPRWSRKFENIYTDVAAASGRLYLVIRSREGSGAAHEYRLLGLDSDTGDSLWESTLPEKVTLAPFVCHNQVVVATEQGALYGFNSETGEKIWQFVVGDGSSPIFTRLLSDGGYVLAATRTGDLAAVSLYEDAGAEASPEQLLQNGEFEAAAEAFALAGQFREAAEIYRDSLHDPEKALAVFKHAGLFQDAAEVAESLSLNTLAIDLYRSAGDPHKVALVHVRTGNFLEAARILEEIGELDSAARLYEKTAEHHKALELYKRLNMLTQVARLSALVSGSDEDIAFLEQAGRLKDAAQVAEKFKKNRKAVDLYGKAGLEEDEFRILTSIVAENPEEWSLERLGVLAAQREDHLLTARVMDQLQRPRQSAEAYQRAAREMAAEQPQDPSRIADLYEKAMVRFSDAGMSADSRDCYRMVIQLRKLPYIEVRARMMDKFREEEINEAVLEVENTGMGLAYDVRVRIGGDRFEVDETTGAPVIHRLAAARGEQHKTYLRPKPGQYGGAVPLHLGWSWLDRDGVQYENHVTKSVAVRRREDSDVSKPEPIEMRPVDMATSRELGQGDLRASLSETSRPAAALQAPLKVLYMAANPANMTRLSIDAEHRAIMNVLQTLPHTNQIDLEYRGAIQTSDLQALLLAEKPTIVHFSGHGSRSGEIYIEDVHGDGRPISSQALGDLFGLLKGNIRLVFLNACYSEEQAQAIAEHIDCVVGMSDEIEDEAARTFSTAFYRAIGFGTDLLTAFNLGCNAIDIENLDDAQVPKILSPLVDAGTIRFFNG